MPPLNLTPPKTVDFSQVSTVKNVNLGNQYGVGGQGFSTQTPTNSTTQVQTPAVGAQFGLDKAAQQPLSVTSPKVGQQFGLDKAASQPMTVTGNPQSGQPVAMDLNKRSDRRLMRRYIRSQRDNGNIARGINAWKAVRNMRNGQNQYGIQWDSTGHQIQSTQPQLPTVGVPQGLQKTWDNSSAGLNTLNSLQSTAMNSTMNNLNNNFTQILDQNKPSQPATPTRSRASQRTSNVSPQPQTQTTATNVVDDGGASNGVYMSRPVKNTSGLPAGSAAYPKGDTGPSLWSMAKNFISGLFPTNVWSTSAGAYTPSRKYGGVLKAQQGAQIPTKNSNTPALDAIINNPQLAEQFLSVLSQQLGKEVTLEDLTTAAANPETGAQLEQLAQQMMKQSAKQGAKLEYISRLRGKCPEGQELVYFAKGGKVCSACMGKKMEDGGEAGYMKSFRDRQKKKQMEKCGGKMKKSK